MSAYLFVIKVPVDEKETKEKKTDKKDFIEQTDQEKNTEKKGSDTKDNCNYENGSGSENKDADNGLSKESDDVDIRKDEIISHENNKDKQQEEKDSTDDKQTDLLSDDNKQLGDAEQKANAQETPGSTDKQNCHDRNVKNSESLKDTSRKVQNNGLDNSDGNLREDGEKSDGQTSNKMEKEVVCTDGIHKVDDKTFQDGMVSGSGKENDKIIESGCDDSSNLDNPKQVSDEDDIDDHKEDDNQHDQSVINEDEYNGDSKEADGTQNEIAENVEEKRIEETDEKGQVSFLDIPPLIESVKEVLKFFSIDNVIVSKTDNGKCWQIFFVDEGGERCENILNKLAEHRIGDIPSSTICIFPASIYRGAQPQEVLEEEDDDNASLASDDGDKEMEGKFKKSIRARMLVTQVVNSVKENAEFTFDYVLLIILASIIAGLGLAENSSVVLVASMLVSPLMGPILALTFGTVIQNNSLRSLGLKNETLGLLLCIISGFIFGMVTGAVGIHGAVWGSGDVWPSDEMKSRGMLRGLWVGVLIALPSGAGVALSVLGGNAGSLVGVAISASLLPPAVNAGMLWAYSILSAIFPPALIEVKRNETLGNQSMITTELVYGGKLNCTSLENNNYEPIHNCNMSVETAILGVISLTLTLLNISCIIIMGIIVLKIKEVAPQASVDENTTFWHEDIKIVRDSYATTKGKDSATMATQARQIIQEWKKNKGEGPEKTLQLKKILQDLEKRNNPKGIPKDSTAEKAFSKILEDDFNRAEMELLDKSPDDYDLTPDIKKMPYDVYKTLTAHNNYNTIHHVYKRKTRRKVKRSSSLEVINEDSPPKKPIKTPPSNSKASSGSKKIHFPGFKSIKIGRPESALAKRRQKGKKTRFQVDKVEEDPPSTSSDRHKNSDVEMSLLPQA